MAPTDPPSERPRVNDRSLTEAALQDAALRLIERHGVLAGLNLREVADEAAVNRGLLYQYFGSRRDLLRAALKRDAAKRFEAVRAVRHQPLRQRTRWFLRTMLEHRQAVELTTLLVLDGDRQIRTMPLRQATMSGLLRDRSEGRLALADLEALHAALVSLVYGYTVYRDHFANELEIPAGELDSRVEKVLDTVLANLETPPPS